MGPPSTHTPYVEPWLGGTYTDVPAVGRAVLHALDLAFDDLTKWTEGLTDAELHSQPLGLPSLAFHLRHIARSVDRNLTYAEGNQLSRRPACCAESRELWRRESLCFAHDCAGVSCPCRHPHPRPRHRQLRSFPRGRPQAATHHPRRRTHPRCRPHPAPHRPGSHDRQSPKSTAGLRAKSGFTPTDLPSPPSPGCAPSFPAWFSGSQRSSPAAQLQPKRAPQRQSPQTPSLPPFPGLFVISRTFVTPSSFSTSAGISYPRQSAAKPSSHVRFHCIQALILQLVGFQLRHQANPAALLLLVEQYPRALLPISPSASSSCSRQSQRSEPNTSPVRHCEWIRTSGGADECRPSPTPPAPPLRLCPRCRAHRRSRAPRQPGPQIPECERPPPCREIRLRNLLHTLKCHSSILRRASDTSRPFPIPDP